MRVTFFVESVLGYVGNPAALYTRGLAEGLALRGNDVRLVEERGNAAFERTLREAGAQAARHFHVAFPQLQYHTYEPRSGAPLLEWVSRELALVDVGVAVAGLGNELCRWLANVSREGLQRVFLLFEPEQLTRESAEQLEVARFDLLLAPRDPGLGLPWKPLPLTVTRQDREAGLTSHPSPRALAEAVSPVDAAEAFEQAVRR